MPGNVGCIAGIYICKYKILNNQKINTPSMFKAQ